MKRFFAITVVLVMLVTLAAQCGEPQVIEKEVVVTKEVEKVVTKEVEKEVVVTKEVEVEKVVAGKTLVFWSTEEQPARAAATQEILKRFEEESGIHVELVLTNEDALPSLMTAAVAAGTLPDLVFHPLDFTIGWEAEGILDAAAATEAIEALGEETFAEGAMNMVKVSNGYAAVPCDGWGQLIVYRKDWFDEKGLEPPTSYENIMAAAEAFTEGDVYGMTAATAAGQVFTQQTFEHFALANGCQLVDDAGNVTLDTPECVEAVQFFVDLTNNYGTPGEQDVVTTRANYFAGQAAMIVWSPFILDEMAGLRDAAFPSCPECADDPAYLAKNSGIAPAFSGPKGAPAQYGQVSYMGITTNADKEAAMEFLNFWFNDGYLDWLAVSVEGKLPMRRGTADEPTKFIDGWKELETGVDRKAKLSEFYSEDVINTLIEGANSFDRWGFTQGQGKLVTAVYESLPVPLYLRDALDGNMSAEDAVKEMQLDVEELQQEMTAEE